MNREHDLPLQRDKRKENGKHTKESEIIRSMELL
jgi:hypothetical protein